MTAPAICKTSDTLRVIGGAVAVAVRGLSLPRVVATVVGITVLIALAALVPLPTAVQLRDWATSVGPWFPLTFFVAHVVATMVPLPRTAFTLAAGLLFGPVTGVLLAVLASTTSAVLALLLVRAAGWRLQRIVRHRAVHRLDELLRARGWVSLLSLRLIPAVPFAVLNYAAGASAIRVLPYTLATLSGLLPGTAAVVILGDALARHPNPALILVSVGIAALGVAGLVFEIRRYQRQHQRSTPDYSEPVREPAITR